jgi:hypothetical protein
MVDHMCEIEAARESAVPAIARICYVEMIACKPQKEIEISQARLEARRKPKEKGALQRGEPSER